MAIKKGAFELYTQERKLPEKKGKSPVKTSHFFDDIYIKDNGSQLVHERFTPNEAEQFGNHSNNISPALISNANNGSQLVHEQFTTNETEQFANHPNHESPTLIDNANNGSQLVHEQFTANKPEQFGNHPNHTSATLIDNAINGSQLVHEQFTANKPVQFENHPNQASSALIGNAINGSQLVHEQLTANEGAQVGNQTTHTSPALTGNTNSGSQLVHEKVDSLASNTGDAQTSELEQIPQIRFSKLVGNQRLIIIALYKNMKINKSDTTEELTLELISKITGVNQKSLKNTLFRLNNGGVLIRVDQKVGRGGWVKYKINANIIKEIQEKEFLR